MYSLIHNVLLLCPSPGFLCSRSYSGKEAVHVTVPDTITEWKAMTFCTSQASGFGLSPTVGLTAFKPFFVELTLPYSVVRGESFRLTATIFNYLKDCIRVRAGDMGSRCPWERGDVSPPPHFPKPLCVVSCTQTLYFLNTFRFRLTWVHQISTRWNRGQILRAPAVSVLMKQKAITGTSPLSNWVREGSDRGARKAYSKTSAMENFTLSSPAFALFSFFLILFASIFFPPKSML